MRNLYKTCRHPRVGGPFIGTRTIRWQHLPTESRESLRDSLETRQSTGRQGDEGETRQNNHSPSYWLQGSIHRAGQTTRQNNQPPIPSPLMETFAKLSGTTIMCPYSQSSKLAFPIDSRLRGNDGRFCKGLLDGRGIKGEGENDAMHRPNPTNLRPSFPRRRAVHGTRTIRRLRLCAVSAHAGTA